MDRGPPLEGCAQRPVQPRLQEELAVPGDDVREQVAVEGRVVVEKVAQIQCRPGGGELVEADLARGDLGPAALLHELVLGVGRSLADCLEDHASMLAAMPPRP